ncbi:hypothetical protein KSS87_012573 [Heliosperma pusillum]|nr:hypothetical protein KSS87_012573 [Heliosperma pusillum]
MPSIRAPSSTKKTTTLTVAVRCRPLTEIERQRSRNIVQVIDEKEVVVLEPELAKDYLNLLQNRNKERRYSFDYAFGPNSCNLDLYKRVVSSTIAGVVQGINSTIFAYGSTGSGKTHTMVGTQEDPGLMVLSLHTIFDFIEKDDSPEDFEVTCSYLEVYNEVIYDLLEKSSGNLELREDPEQGVTIAGLRSIKVHSAVKILELLTLGNSRRKTESTESNATSSRERASETNSSGKTLRDGANINRSLLALANCINALGKLHKKGLAYVPYRNSKLTRILKDGLSGNSQTIMVATISPSHRHYHHTTNTLKYANRAKEIKTHVQKNFATLDSHISDYQRIINSLQTEVCRLKKELAEKESRLRVNPIEKSADVELSWLNIVSREISENVQERINLQKAVLELEETNLHNRVELQRLDEEISQQQTIEMEGLNVKTLRERRQIVLDNIRDNDEVGAEYQKEIEANEKQRCQLQGTIDEAIKNNGNTTYLQILSQYRLLVMANSELQFEMAMRDQVIHDQREAHRNLRNLLLGLKVDQERLLGYASKEGIPTEDMMTTKAHSACPGNHMLLNTVLRRFSSCSSSPSSPCTTGQPYTGPSSVPIHIRSSIPEPRLNWTSDYPFSKQQHECPYLSYDQSLPSHSRAITRHDFPGDQIRDSSLLDHCSCKIPISLVDSLPTIPDIISTLPLSARSVQAQEEKVYFL